MLDRDMYNAKCALLRALSDETRIKILEELRRKKRLTVSEICEKLGKDQSSISHHLYCLRNCGLVRTERDGRFIFYSLNGRERVSRILELVDEHVKESLEAILRCEVVK